MTEKDKEIAEQALKVAGGAAGAVGGMGTGIVAGVAIACTVCPPLALTAACAGAWLGGVFGAKAGYKTPVDGLRKLSVWWSK